MSTQVPIATEALFEPLLTSREAAPFVRLHYKTLELMARKGTVPGMKKGKSWVFRLSRLSKWIDQELESKPAPGNSARRASQ
jgi:excisionase family DNA binding protein